jgi:hypothetical protein
MPTKYQLYLLAIVAVFIIGLSWFFYSKGKKTVTLQNLPGELPGNPDSGNVRGASNDEIKSIATDLYQDLNGFNIFGHDSGPYDRANLLDDIDLVKLYNAFNTQYQKESNQTLTQWLDSDVFAPWGYITMNNLRKRLIKLNSK